MQNLSQKSHVEIVLLYPQAQCDENASESEECLRNDECKLHSWQFQKDSTSVGTRWLF